MSDTEKMKDSISVKVASADKKRVEAIFDELGLSLSTAINIFIKKSIAEGGLPLKSKIRFTVRLIRPSLIGVLRRWIVINSHSHSCLDNREP